MEDIRQTVLYIIDVYSRFDDNTDVRMIFSLYNKWYCIREIKDLEWGEPVFKEKHIEENSYYYLYPSLEEAKAFVQHLKQLERKKL